MKYLWSLIGAALILTVLGLVVVQPAAAQDSRANWRAEFFANQQLIGPAVYTANFGEVNFNWGAGSPNPAVPVDGWSARFGTDVNLPAGTYRFAVTADDSFQLWVDYQQVLNTYNAPRPGETLTVDLTLEAGSHHLQLDYREIEGNAYVRLTWIDVNNIPPAPQPVAGNWTAEYFANPTLSGTPFATLFESSVSHNWGFNAPLGGMPADNFSVRWTSTIDLAAGEYSIQATADDGVRVFVNGIGYINEWRLATGQTYTAPVRVIGGPTTIVVEYFEAGAVALIDFRLNAPVTAPAPAPQTPTGPTATVITGRLNVRNAPSAINSQVLIKIDNGQIYPVLGRNADSSWWQINVNGITGWVSGRYVQVSGAGGVPVIDAPQPQVPTTPTGFTVQTTVNLNLRAGPTTASEPLLVIPRGSAAAVLGRNADNSWLRVNFDGTVGWVAFRYVTSETPLDFSQIPVQQ
jgi:uncharacterized protein YraI/uncharacterized protein YndB with AHSA1/START domain